MNRKFSKVVYYHRDFQKRNCSKLDGNIFGYLWPMPRGRLTRKIKKEIASFFKADLLLIDNRIRSTYWKSIIVEIIQKKVKSWPHSGIFMSSNIEKPLVMYILLEALLEQLVELTPVVHHLFRIPQGILARASTGRMVTSH